jgi:hypothetical protein
VSAEQPDPDAGGLDLDWADVSSATSRVISRQT